MIAITVELLHGTYRADPDGLAHTGRLERGEWPPAPLRLLAALVAADGMGSDCRHTDGSELAFIEGCVPPAIYASPPDRVWHQPLQPRYVARAQARFAKDKPTAPRSPSMPSTSAGRGPSCGLASGWRPPRRWWCTCGRSMRLRT